MKKKKWNKKVHSYPYLNKNMNSIVIALIGLLVAVPPLFFIEHDSGKLNEEFQAVMLINAELKYSIVLTFTSIICGIVIGTLYFKNKIK